MELLLVILGVMAFFGAAVIAVLVMATITVSAFTSKLESAATKGKADKKTQDLELQTPETESERLARAEILAWHQDQAARYGGASAAAAVDTGTEPRPAAKPSG